MPALHTIEDIRGVLGALDLPSRVLDWHVETGEDANGYPAIWVLAILPDETAVDSDEAVALWSSIWEGLTAADADARWVYLSFRSESEAISE